MDETCEDDDDFEKIFQKLFDNLLGDDDNIPEEESEVSELKKLYRELCLQYHPDRMGAHDAKTQRLWHEIQDAYVNRDLEGLRAIRSGIELESGETTLSCSEIDEIMGWLCLRKMIFPSENKNLWLILYKKEL